MLSVLKKISAFVVATLLALAISIGVGIVIYLVMSKLRVAMIRNDLFWLIVLNFLNIAFPVVWFAGSLTLIPTIWRKTYLFLSA